MTARVGRTLLLILALLALAPAAAAAAADCRVTSLPEIEDEVMCPICGVPLVNAGGQQAENERNFIRDLVDQCRTERQIKAALVDEYGNEVLAMPDDEGFGLAAYLVPIGGIALAAVALAIGAVRWRRARDSGGAAPAGGGAPQERDDRDLDSDLRRYDL
ncbi:MAG: cytochrome c-type biogenesis protein CcmH [Actinobacteria bacterium]|nr:cytochrome c-type biogenesis protein CcmH [Actinomycetota bacterium]